VSNRANEDDRDEDEGEGEERTSGGGGAAVDAAQAVPELVLRAVELRKGRGEVLELLVELLLDLRELLRLEGVEVDCCGREFVS